MVLDPGREYGSGDPADEPDVQEDQQREMEEERARDDDDVGEEAPARPRSLGQLRTSCAP